jgi:hypothetical protein
MGRAGGDTGLAAELTRTSAQAARRREQTEARRRAKQVDDDRKQAKELAAPIIAELPAKLKAAAKKGDKALIVVSNLYGYFNREQDLTMRGVSAWAYEQGLQTFHEKRRPVGSDDYGDEVFGIRWN